MAALATLNIDLGVRTYDIADTEGNVIGSIRFNPSDPGMVARWDEARSVITDALANPPETAEEISDLDGIVKTQLNQALGSDVSSVIFQGVSSLAVCADGSFVIENVLEALAPIIEGAIQEATEKSEKRIQKHTAKYKNTKRGMAPGQQ